jgi:hypothetical protein
VSQGGKPVLNSESEERKEVQDWTNFSWEKPDPNSPPEPSSGGNNAFNNIWSMPQIEPKGEDFLNFETAGTSQEGKEADRTTDLI